MLRRRWIPSPNFDDRPNNACIEFLIIHYTACDLELSLKILTDGASSNRVSSHYLIAESGEIYHLVDEEKRAWHAGVSAWRHYQGINAFSLGIELVNPGHGPHYRPFSTPQMASLIELSRELMTRHPIRKEYVLGHADVAPLRKVDPGSFFDWKALSGAGVGVYASHQPRPHDAKRLDPQSIDRFWTTQQRHVIAKLLSDWGYVFDENQAGAFEATLEAFIAHYCPEHILHLEFHGLEAILSHLLLQH
ncbi:MAG: N-acetylmuramoyl-L-alanine amidase [Candidatus Nucleicultricaceae bacterium]